MSTIRNTTDDMKDPAWALLALADAMGNGGSPSRFIEEQERNGQAQLVNSDRLPTKGSEDPGFTDAGFTFGDPDPRDELFRPATLPPGWKREGSDHAMWSHVVDEHGRNRVAIFYKAAFYDRKAHMHLETPASYLRSCLYEGASPVLDEAWLTPLVAAETLEALAKQSDEQALEFEGLAKWDDNDYWIGRVNECRAEAAKARALAASLVQS